MSKKPWLDRPDADGYWWLLSPDKKRTVGFVSFIGTGGMFHVHLIGYRETFNDRDVDIGSLRNMKWKRIPET